LEPDDAGGVLAEPIDAGAHDLLPESPALPLGPHSEGAHPPFDPGAMRDVERDDLLAFTTPRHRPRPRILDRITPDRRIQDRQAPTDHPVTAVAFRERVAEHLVQRGDVRLPHGVRPVSMTRGFPIACGRHQPVASNSSYALSSSSSGSRGGSSRTG